MQSRSRVLYAPGKTETQVYYQREEVVDSLAHSHSRTAPFAVACEFTRNTAGITGLVGPVGLATL